MVSKIRVTKTMGGEYWMLFEEKDVRKACVLWGCKKDMIEDCIIAMKTGENDCTCCYINLVNEIKAEPEYMDAKGQSNGVGRENKT